MLTHLQQQHTFQSCVWLHDGFWLAPPPTHDQLQASNLHIINTYGLSQTEPPLFRCSPLVTLITGRDTICSNSSGAADNLVGTLKAIKKRSYSAPPTQELAQQVERLGKRQKTSFAFLTHIRSYPYNAQPTPPHKRRRNWSPLADPSFPFAFFTVAVDPHSTFFTLTLLYFSTTIFLPHNHSFHKVVLKGSKGSKDKPHHRSLSIHRPLPQWHRATSNKQFDISHPRPLLNYPQDNIVLCGWGKKKSTTASTRSAPRPEWGKNLQNTMLENKPGNKKSWHISGKRNIQMTRITGLDSSGRNELGMQDGLKAGMNQPVVHPPDGTRNGRDPKRLEVTLPPGPLVVQYSAA